MELVFEIINRAGRILERHKLSGNSITIGRAFDNDLILSDQTIDAHHAVIHEDENQQIQLIDTNSVNGVWDNRHQRIKENVTLNSGDEYTLGKTRIRVYKTNHPVTKTININFVDTVIHHFGKTPAMIVTALLLIGATINETWLNMFSEVKWETITGAVMLLLSMVVIYALFWALIGRIVKHEMRFKSQFTIISLYLFISFALQCVNELVLYNTLESIGSFIFAFINNFILLTLLFWLNLYIATNQSAKQRWKISAALSLVFISMVLYQDITNYFNFSTRPDYITEIKPPVMRIAEGVSQEEFITSGSVVFIPSEPLQAE